MKTPLGKEESSGKLKQPSLFRLGKLRKNQQFCITQVQKRVISFEQDYKLFLETISEFICVPHYTLTQFVRILLI